MFSFPNSEGAFMSFGYSQANRLCNSTLLTLLRHIQVTIACIWTISQVFRLRLALFQPPPTPPHKACLALAYFSAVQYQVAYSGFNESGFCGLENQNNELKEAKPVSLANCRIGDNFVGWSLRDNLLHVYIIIQLQYLVVSLLILMM